MAVVYIFCMSEGMKESCRFNDSSSSGEAQESGCKGNELFTRKPSPKLFGLSMKRIGIGVK